MNDFAVIAQDGTVLVTCPTAYNAIRLARTVRFAGTAVRSVFGTWQPV